MPNRLINEKSPYLLQHANNPVDWYPWGDEAFRKAREENKPIFLSVGYSTCHWCHVMEHESFERDDIAELLNRYFVPIKVDREERPDVDRVYMTFVQATTGSGGWPMSVFLTPDLKPFFGGTYFPPENYANRPGFKYLLERIAEAWRTERASIVQSSGDVLEQLRDRAEAGQGYSTLDDAVLDSGYYAFRRSFDAKYGGFGGAPKFPRPSVHNFLLRYYGRTRSVEAIEMVFATLNMMARGGINDQLGGGFHRYSVDERWFVPHFEKMLYDQAQLAISYLEALQVSNDQYYAGVAQRTLDYVLRDMTHPEGGFYSAEDADSIIDPAKPEEKGEGAFYLWTEAEIRDVLGRPDAEWFCHHFGIQERGNVMNDPQGEFVGKNILFEAHKPEETAAHFGIEVERLQDALESAKRRLLEVREKRPRPHLDDKILTAWNGLMISAFALGARVLEQETYATAARRAAEFVLNRLCNPDDGTLLRRFREGEAAIPGFLDDYAFFVQGLLDLYETDFVVRDLELALKLTETMVAEFEDPDASAFFSSSGRDESVILRVKDDYDGAEPAGNSIAILNLFRLAEITGRSDLRQHAERALQALARRISAAALAVPQLLVSYMFGRGKPKQIIVAGEKSSAETRALLKALNRQFVPNRVVLLLDDASREILSKWNPVVKDMGKIGGRATAYVCENYACKLPTADVAEFTKQLA